MYTAQMKGVHSFPRQAQEAATSGRDNRDPTRASHSVGRSSGDWVSVGVAIFYKGEGKYGGLLGGVIWGAVKSRGSEEWGRVCGRTGELMGSVEHKVNEWRSA